MEIIRRYKKWSRRGDSIIQWIMIILITTSIAISVIPPLRDAAVARLSSSIEYLRSTDTSVGD